MFSAKYDDDGVTEGAPAVEKFWLMMYLLTMGWSLAHTSLAITPEHSATNGEYSSLRSALLGAGHSKSIMVPLITQSYSTSPSVLLGCRLRQGGVFITSNDINLNLQPY